MKQGARKATTLRIILIVCIIIELILGVIGFYFAKNMLTDYAVVVSHAVADAKASADNVTTLKTLQAELKQQQANEAKAALITSPISSFQNQVITDIDNYAQYAGLSVTNYSFAAPVAAATTTAATATTTAATAKPAVATSSTSTVTVTIGSPVSYSALLKFIRAIETNLPKMQISSLNIGRSTTSEDLVTTDTLTIAVFTK